MPFITKDRREIIDSDGLGGLDKLHPEDTIQKGDRCYFFYKQMVDAWKANPRWATVHKIFKSILNSDLLNVIEEDNFVAVHLAWQVFFQLHVMPYELKKREENGDI